MNNVSDDLLWLCVRNRSSFLVKRNGAQFTREPNNIMSLNKFKYSGLANAKAVGIELDEETKNPVLSTVTTKSSKPSRRAHKVMLKEGRGPARNNKTIESAVGKYFYRRDLVTATLAKHTKLAKASIRKAKGVKPVVKPKRGRN